VKGEPPTVGDLDASDELAAVLSCCALDGGHCRFAGGHMDEVAKGRTWRPTAWSMSIFENVTFPLAKVNDAISGIEKAQANPTKEATRQKGHA
jgi:hypothetical protein